jgi:hypothetical protein
MIENNPGRAFIWNNKYSELGSAFVLLFAEVDGVTHGIEVRASGRMMMFDYTTRNYPNWFAREQQWTEVGVSDEK